MNTEDRDQIVAQLREAAEAANKQGLVLLDETSTSANIGMGRVTIIQGNTYAKLADIFSTLRTE